MPAAEGREGSSGATRIPADDARPTDPAVGSTSLPCLVGEDRLPIPVIAAGRRLPNSTVVTSVSTPQSTRFRMMFRWLAHPIAVMTTSMLDADEGHDDARRRRDHQLRGAARRRRRSIADAPQRQAGTSATMISALRSRRQNRGLRCLQAHDVQRVQTTGKSREIAGMIANTSRRHRDGNGVSAPRVIRSCLPISDT